MSETKSSQRSWLAQLVTFAAIVAGGVAVGYYTYGPAPTQFGNGSNENSPKMAPDAVANAVAQWHEGAEHRFPLGEAEASDIIESPALAADGDRVFLAWVAETGVDERSVFLSRSDDGGETFSEPQIVVRTGVFTAISEMRGRRVERRLRTLPRLALAEKRLYLSWVDAGDTLDSVVLRLAWSDDEGRNFSSSLPVHASRQARPTFTSLQVAEDGTVACSWLDNRNHVQQPFAAVLPAGAAEFSPEQMVYSGTDNHGVCPCCSTAALHVPGTGTFVAFRGNEAGYRDMWVSISRAPAGAFQPPRRAVETPQWQFDGCPHDGPSLAASTRLHMAWMDARSGVERIYYGSADLDMPKFDSRELFHGRDGVQGHPHLVANGDVLHLVWDDTLQPTHAPDEVSPERGSSGRPNHQGHQVALAGSSRTVLYSRSTDGGASFTEPVPLQPVEGAFQSRPQLAVTRKGDVFVAWMELGVGGKSVVVHRLQHPGSFVNTSQVAP
ncbi:MAG: exo-alpha-sialidase [Planctomycetales bacterium]|nr:exo-alpha-sialidase [Planctomycetales bacterium]